MSDESYVPRVTQQGLFAEPCGVCKRKTQESVLVQTLTGSVACLCFPCLRVVNTCAARLVKAGKIKSTQGDKK